MTSVIPQMMASRIHEFGPPEVIAFEKIARPEPGHGQVRVRVRGARVGPWDAWIRAGMSVLPQPLPLTLPSDLSGVVDIVGPIVTGLEPGMEVFGVTNRRFTGAYAEYALADADMIAQKPAALERPGLFHPGPSAETAHLARIAEMIDTGTLKTRIGTVLPHAEARRAHQMLEGLLPRPRGKIVLQVGE
jgi:NADPH:quinone reductase-like Zn-dependent oxidoreductase